VATAVNNINARGADYNAYFDEFYALGQRLRRQGDAALARGHAVSARDAYLRSAMYFAQALFFVLGTRDPSRETAVYRTMRVSWRRATALFNPPVEHVRIPYAGTWLPGNFFKAAPSNALRPTVIVNNGSDSQNVEVYAQYGAAALERGYNVLIFEGPGQGSMLFERRVPFRPDWEAVITPVVDFLRARPDVNAAKIALIGVSFGGVLTPRAVAFEHRLAALCTDPGVVDAIRSWHFPPQLLALLEKGQRQEVNAIWARLMTRATPQEKFILAKRSEVFLPKDFYDLAKTLQRYTCRDVAGQITTPMLVMAPELEQFWPGQSQELYDLLTALKTLARFTVAEAAQFHDEPMASQHRNGVLFDWMSETLVSR